MPAPRMRALLALNLLTHLAVEIIVDEAVQLPSVTEQSGSVATSIADSFDVSLLIMLAGAIASTISQPKAMTFVKLPTDLQAQLPPLLPPPVPLPTCVDRRRRRNDQELVLYSEGMRRQQRLDNKQHRAYEKTSYKHTRCATQRFSGRALNVLSSHGSMKGPRPSPS